MNRNDILATADVAELLGMSDAGVRAMRQGGRGPAYVKVGDRTLVYLRQDVEAWLEECQQALRARAS